MKAKKLFLYSLKISSDQQSLFEKLAGKPASECSMLMIENATDIIPDSEGWVRGIRESWSSLGYRIQRLDLREYIDNNKRLENSDDKLGKIFSDADIVWVCGGHTYYLRWILAASGAENFIRKHVEEGKLYAGWSAGAVVAGPVISHFDNMGDDPAEAPEQLNLGLGLVPFCIVPHMDMAEFAEGARMTNKLLISDGVNTCPLNDDQAVIVENEIQLLVNADGKSEPILF